MPIPVSPLRSLTLSPVPRSTAPVRSASVASTAPVVSDTRASKNSPTYPSYSAQPEPSLWNGVKLVARGLGEILWVTAKAAGTVLQWAGMAAVAILGLAWDITKAVFNGLARGVRAIFDPGYDPYRPWQHGEPSPPGSPWRY